MTIHYRLHSTFGLTAFAPNLIHLYQLQVQSHQTPSSVHLVSPVRGDQAAKGAMQARAEETLCTHLSLRGRDLDFFECAPE